jgi:hypothetical protein
MIRRGGFQIEKADPTIGPECQGRRLVVPIDAPVLIRQSMCITAPTAPIAIAIGPSEAWNGAAKPDGTGPVCAEPEAEAPDPDPVA